MIKTRGLKITVSHACMGLTASRMAREIYPEDEEFMAFELV